MSLISLKARERSSQSPDGQDKIPAVIYGPNSKNQNLELNYRDFSQAYGQAGESTLVDLTIDNKHPVKVLIQDIQKDPRSDKYIHVDFYQLDMDKKLSLEVELVFMGIEEIEKATSGEVIKNMSRLEVECLPKDLVREIKINLGDFLKKIGDALHAKDIKLPTGLILVTDKEASLASVQEIKEEVIEEAKAEEKETEAGEVEKEGEESEVAGEKAEDKQTGNESQEKSDAKK